MSYSALTTVGRKLGLTDSWGFTVFGMILTLGLGVALVVALAFAAALFPSRAVGRTTCRNFASQTGFKTKFVILNWADTGTCLAQAPNGRWVKNSQIVQFVQGSR